MFVSRSKYNGPGPFSAFFWQGETMDYGMAIDGLLAADGVLAKNYGVWEAEVQASSDGVRSCRINLPAPAPSLT